MFRLWAKTFRDNHMLQDTCIEDGSGDTRTHKVLRALEEACLRLDLPTPFWLKSTEKDFRRYRRARFTQDNFLEEIPFDYLEIQIIEED